MSIFSQRWQAHHPPIPPRHRGAERLEEARLRCASRASHWRSAGTGPDKKDSSKSSICLRPRKNEWELQNTSRIFGYSQSWDLRLEQPNTISTIHNLTSTFLGQSIWIFRQAPEVVAVRVEVMMEMRIKKTNGKLFSGWEQLGASDLQHWLHVLTVGAT